MNKLLTAFVTLSCFSFNCYAQDWGTITSKELHNQWETLRVCFSSSQTNCTWRASTIGTTPGSTMQSLLQIDYSENTPYKVTGQLLQPISANVMQLDLPKEIAAICETYIDSRLIKKSPIHR